ncbi:transcription elongation factor S-II [Umbelopsis sp. PMI_123]|nr:transcription elongation factor S-II [Umbelopsis sp. PMI_123]
MPDNKIRSKSVDLLTQALIGQDNNNANINDKSSSLANHIEQEIFSQHGQEINNEYKEAVRSHVFNLKDSKNNLRSRLLNDELQPTVFADMASSEMAAPERRRSNEKLRRESLRDSMAINDLQPMHRDLEDPDAGRD